MILHGRKNAIVTYFYSVVGTSVQENYKQQRIEQGERGHFSLTVYPTATVREEVDYGLVEVVFNYFS